MLKSLLLLAVVGSGVSAKEYYPEYAEPEYDAPPKPEETKPYHPGYTEPEPKYDAAPKPAYGMKEKRPYRPEYKEYTDSEPIYDSPPKPAYGMKEKKPYRPEYAEPEPEYDAPQKPAYNLKETKPYHPGYTEPEPKYDAAPKPAYGMKEEKPYRPEYNGVPCRDQNELGRNGKFRCGIWANMYPHERDVLDLMFDEKHNIRRKVTFVKDGVITKTHSKDPAMSRWITEHIAHAQDMVARGDRILYHKPTNQMLWRAHEEGSVGYDIKWGDDGTAYIHQYGADPCAVEVIQRHALDVNGLVEHGLEWAEEPGEPAPAICNHIYRGAPHKSYSANVFWEY